MIDSLIERIVRVLLASKGPVTSRQIAADIGMSESTVRHAMSRVRSFIDSCKGDAELRSLPGKGVWIQGGEAGCREVSDRLSRDFNPSDSPAFRLNYILGILAHRRSNYTIQLFADDLGVSRKIVERDLRYLARHLRSFNIALSKTPNVGVRIDGAEPDIRDALTESARRLLEGSVANVPRPDDLDLRISGTFFSYFRLAYPGSDLRAMQGLALEIESQAGIRFSDASFTYLVEYLALAQFRMGQGCFCRLPRETEPGGGISALARVSHRAAGRLGAHAGQRRARHRHLGRRDAMPGDEDRRPGRAGRCCFRARYGGTIRRGGIGFRRV